jgi:hypothetical protein
MTCAESDFRVRERENAQAKKALEEKEKVIEELKTQLA